MGALISPDWPAPGGILAFTTTRTGGSSMGPYKSFNLAQHVGDDAEVVSSNRVTMAQWLPGGVAVQWLTQVHGVAVAKAPAPQGVTADAVWTDQPGIALAVLTADCLPILLCTRDGRHIAAIHAGWRGLAAGVVEATLHSMPAPAETVLAWLGPAIGPQAFEVGPEVRRAFVGAAVEAPSELPDHAFVASSARAGHFLADIYALGRHCLQSAGVTHIYGGGRCTVTEPESFFSYRRDRETGRMASLICIKPAQNHS